MNLGIFHPRYTITAPKRLCCAKQRGAFKKRTRLACETVQGENVKMCVIFNHYSHIPHRLTMPISPR
jgi:hypothetical protein